MSSFLSTVPVLILTATSAARLAAGFENCVAIADRMREELRLDYEAHLCGGVAAARSNLETTASQMSDSIHRTFVASVLDRVDLMAPETPWNPSPCEPTPIFLVAQSEGNTPHGFPNNVYRIPWPQH